MQPRVYNVLFLSTGNSARSVMAEAILNSVGKGRFRAFSAGSHPTGKVNPFALGQIAKAGLSTEGFRSKSWDELARPGAAAMDCVFTVCSDAAEEVCPHWPGHPMTVHWGVDDPAQHSGTDAEKQRVFALAFAQLSHRIRTFVSLPIDKLDRLSLIKNLEAIRPQDCIAGWPRSRAGSLAYTELASAAMVFRQAVQKDWEAVSGLLGSCSLPIDGARQHFADFLLAFKDGALAACSGLECYGDVALLRSVGVAPYHRGRGLGRELCGRLLASARERNIRSLVLLTESAQDFFVRMGFEVVPRTMLPEQVNVSEELRRACPASAIAMHRSLA